MFIKSKQKTLKTKTNSNLIMKCKICKNKINETFLGKIIGTYIKDEKGKKHNVCFECQKKFKSKKEILEKIK